jgi:hypothetical protein
MSVQNLLDTAFAQPTAPDTREGGLTFTALSPGPWKEFLLGPGAGLGRSGSWDERLAVLWKRVVAQCGAAQRLAVEHGIDWEFAPHESKLILALMGSDDVVIRSTRRAGPLCGCLPPGRSSRTTPSPCALPKPMTTSSPRSSRPACA